MWIHQKFKFDLSGGPGLNGFIVTDDQILMKNDFFGIGPKLGLNTLWSLGGGFGVVGNFNLSLLYGFFELSQQETVTFNAAAPPITYLDLDQNSYHNPRMDFDLFLGLRWDWLSASKNCHLSLEAGWENLIFLGQNQLMRFTSATYPGNNNSVKGDLAIQGVTLRGLINF